MATMLGALAYARMKTDGVAITRPGDGVEGAHVILASPTLTPGLRPTMFGHAMIAVVWGWAPFHFTQAELDRDDWSVVE